MKKLISVLAVLAIFSTVAFAGPYFEVELNPLDADTSLICGWYEEVNDINMSGISITGDIYAVNDNLWVYPTPWMFGGELGVGSDWVWFSLASDLTLLPRPDWTDATILSAWETVFRVEGYPSNIVTLWAEVTVGPSFIPFFGVWEFVPIIGIRCEW